MNNELCTVAPSDMPTHACPSVSGNFNEDFIKARACDWSRGVSCGRGRTGLALESNFGSEEGEGAFSGDDWL